jgi:WhiB family redox-sensing transcriptional regulator
VSTNPRRLGTPTARTDDADWPQHAACAGQQGSLFYPPVRGERKAARIARERQAKAVCASCTVRSDCLNTAIANGERYGIWGGLTDVERRRLLIDWAS